MKKNILFVLLLCNVYNNYSFAQDDIRTMAVKMSMEMLQKKAEANFKEDVVTTASYVPVNGKIDSLLLKKEIDSLISQIKMQYDESSIIMDEQDVSLKKLILKCKYYSFPDYKNVNVYLKEVSVQQKGNDVKISDAEYNKNVEDGLIQAPINYSGYPELEEHIYLSDKYNPFLPLKVKGNLVVNYPSKHEAVEFTIKDTGKTKEFMDYKITLLSVKKNRVAFRVVGPKGFYDNVNKMLVNKDNHPFNFMESGNTSFFLYEEGKKYKYKPDDKILSELASRISMEEGDIDDYLRITVSGTIAKIVFYTTEQMEEKTIPFSLIYKAD